MLEGLARDSGGKNIRIDLHIDCQSIRHINDPSDTSEDFSLVIKAYDLSNNNKKEVCTLIDSINDVESKIYLQKARKFFGEIVEHWLQATN